MVFSNGKPVKGAFCIAFSKKRLHFIIMLLKFLEHLDLRRCPAENLVHNFLSGYGFAAVHHFGFDFIDF